MTARMMRSGVSLLLIWTLNRLTHATVSVVSAFDLCARLADHLAAENPHSSLLYKFQQSGSRYFASTVSALRSFRPPTREIRRWRDELLRGWNEFATAARLSQVTSVPVGYLLSCHWSGCSCHGRKPHHKIRICRGCSMVYYCGPTCQEKYLILAHHRTL